LIARIWRPIGRGVKLGAIVLFRFLYAHCRTSLVGKSTPGLNLALIGVYALVGVGLVFVLSGRGTATQKRESATTAEEASGTPDDSRLVNEHASRDSAGARRGTEEATAINGKSPPRESTSRGAGSDLALVNPAPAGANTTPLAAQASGLYLPDSPRSNDPTVAERQRRIALGVGASLDGLRPFPDDNAWNQDITQAPVDPLSDAILATIGVDRGLHPDFGSGEWEGAKIGIPYVVVSGAQPMVPVEFTEYGDESDAGPYPLPIGAPIESAPRTDADRHALVIDRDNWKLYELCYAFETETGWTAHCGAIFDLAAHPSRPVGWTSADAAGLPVFAGLVRYDEVEAGEIRHALRFTVARTRRAYVPPASHWASRETSAVLPPMGMRVRLKADVDITGYPRHVQVILQCLKTYGMILADNGSNWFISGAPDDRWDDDALHTLKQIRGSDFEVLQMDGLVAE
jgi:hypothetical protein